MFFLAKALETTISEMLERKEKAQMNRIQLKASLSNLLFDIY